MCNLLRKELRLAAHPSLYMFMAMGALVLIPAYPYGVVFFFGGLGVFQTVMFGRETRDVFYTRARVNKGFNNRCAFFWHYCNPLAILKHEKMNIIAVWGFFNPKIAVPCRYIRIYKIII